jgi:glycosyltransferase involved in cell wall biosynthesis
MRLAIVNNSNRKIGGTEHYLEVLLPRLVHRGVELAFVHENAKPDNREALDLPAGTTSWCVEDAGAEATIAALGRWRPDLIFAHGELDPTFEVRYIPLAPTVYFSHNYYGTCVSGLKAYQRPVARPCERRFGVACLALYFPRHCGGMNPITMLSLYRQTARRLRVLRRYDALVTHSRHLQLEYLKHGFPEERVFNLKYEVSTKSNESLVQLSRNDDGAAEPPPAWRMVFVGRMERLKGGRVLIDALPGALAKIGRPLHVSLAGDGTERAAWEAAAAEVHAKHPDITIEFHGWLKGQEFDRLIASTHLVVVPSLWPEPFGKAGLEAGLHGIPSAAFAVGGIPEWLEDGTNGHLAPGDPPTVEGLSQAIAACLSDPLHYRDLRNGARRIANEFNVENHIDQLLAVFHEVAERKK